jgi:hypothetical protein
VILQNLTDCLSARTSILRIARSSVKRSASYSSTQNSRESSSIQNSRESGSTDTQQAAQSRATHRGSELNHTSQPYEENRYSPPWVYTQKWSLLRYTANIADKMMNSDPILIKIFKMKAPNFDITQLLRVQTATPKVQKHAWKVKVRKVTEEFWMLYLFNISSSMSPEDASYIYIF